MSTTIDTRVVEMQFNNQRFEQNVRTSISTLDKLKQSLHLTGAAKGLENINAAAKNNNLPALSSAVETVTAKFSAMQVVGITALANITNQAVNAGKRILSALTIDPVKTGFSEYELKLDSVKTIMASTGEKIEDVNRYLNELNDYSDQTIYSFADMTQNIGKFTNAGVKLEDAVKAIKGISNEAAVSGANANEASRAMYNFAQALSAGHVKLIDWKSIELANMATKEFKEQLIKTAVEVGTLKEASDGMYKTLEGKTLNATKNFNDTLQDEWMTTEVLITTLGRYADETTDIGAKAKAAAQDVTKLSQVFDILKETAQSGWARTWEIIFGDLEQAKALFTPLTNFLSGIIDKMSDTRNAILESALGKSFSSLLDNVTKAMKPINDSVDSIKNVTDSLKDYSKVVNEIIRGDWGRGQTRWDALTEAGYDWAHAQNLVNEQLGCSVRHTTNYKEAQSELSETGTKLTEQDKDRLKRLASLSASTKELTNYTDEQLTVFLKGMHYTDAEIKALKELQAVSEKLGLPMEDLIDNLDEIDGRWIIFHSFENVGKSLVTIFNSIGEAWRKVFHGNASDEEILEKRSNAIFNLIVAMHKLSSKLVISDETASKLTRTFKGVFAIIDVITTLVGGGFKIAFKLVSQILSYFNLDILGLTANIGDAAVKFRDWLDGILDFSGIIKKVAPLIEKVVTSIKKWIIAVKDSEGFSRFTSYIKECVSAIKSWAGSRVEKIIANVQDWITAVKNSGAFGKFIDYLKNSAKAIGDWISGIKDAENIPKYIIEGLVKGLLAGIGAVWSAVIEIGTGILTTIKDILGIHSPSKEFFEIGKNIIQGLFNGLKDGASTVWDFIKSMGEKCIEIFQSIDWNKIIALGISASMIIFLKKVGDALVGIGNAFEGFGEMLSSISKVATSFSKVLNGISWDFKAKAIQKLAISLAILVAALLLLVHAGGDDYLKLWNAVVVLGVLAGILVGLAVAMNKLSSASVKFEKGKGFSADGMKSGLIAIGVSLLMLAAVVKIIGSMSLEQAMGGFVGLAALIGAMTLVFLAYGKLVKGKAAQNIDKAGKMILKLSISLLLLVWVCKLVSKLSPEEMIAGGVFIGAFMTFVLGLTAISLLAGKHIDKIGGMVIKISIAMGLMVGIVKLAGKLSPEEMTKGGVFAFAFLGFVATLLTITKLASKDIPKLSGLLLSISFSMAILVGVVKLASKLSPEEMIKGGLFAFSFLGFLTILMKVLTIGNKQKVAQLTGTILAISVAIAAMAATSILLSLIDLQGLAKGVAAVSILGIILSGMIAATKGAKDIRGNLIVIAVAIAVMAGAVALLTLIDGKKLAGATTVMAVLMGMFALMVKSTKNVKKAALTLTILAVVVVALAGIVWLMSTLEVENSIANATALGGLMLAMAGVLKIISTIRKNTKRAVQNILSLTALVILTLALARILASIDNVQNSITNATALGGLMLAMAGVLAIITKIKISVKDIGSLAVAIIALSVLAVPMWIFAQVLKSMNGIDNAIDNAIALGGLMIAMAAVLGVITLCGLAIPAVITGVAGLLVIAGIAAIFVGLLAWMEGIENATTNAELLKSLMTFVTDLLIQISIVGPQALAGVAALAGLELLMVTMGALVVAIGALVDKFPQIETFIDKGLPIMEKLATGLGTMIGNFVSGMLSSIAAGLPEIGKNLSEFMSNAMFFITGAKLVDEATVNGVKCLASAIIALTIAELINGIASFLSGGISFPDLGKDLSQFMVNAMPFIMIAPLVDESVVNGAKYMAGAIIAMTIAEFISGIASLVTGGVDLPQLGTDLSQFMANAMPFIMMSRMIDESAVKAAESLVGVIIALTASNVLDSIASFFFGDVDFESLGDMLTAFGEAIIDFSNTITEGGGIDTAAIEAAATAGELMVALQSSLPRTGGWLDAILGTQDIAEFGKKCAAFGEAMKQFSDSVSGENAIDEKAIQAAAEAGTLMSELQNTLPKTGGWLQAILGEQDIAIFGAKCAAFGQAMKQFSDSVSGENAIDTAAIEAAHKAGGLMSELQNTLPKTGGWLQAIAGVQDIEDFGNKCAAFGEAMAKFPSVTITDETVTSISKAGEAIIALQDTLPKTGGLVQVFTGETDLEAFGTGCGLFSNAMSTLSGMTAIQDSVIESITTAGKAIVELQKIIPESGGLIQSIAGTTDLETFGSGCVSFSDAMSKLSNMTVISDDTISSVQKAGEMIIKLQEAIPSNTWFDGKVSLTTFSYQIGQFSEAMTKFSEVPTIPGTTITTVNSAGTMITALADAIPVNTWFDGKVSLTTFSYQIGQFSEAMTKFSEVPAIPETTITTVNSAGTMIESFAAAIPINTWLDGKASLGNFSYQIDLFSDAMTKFSEVPAIPETTITTVNSAGTMITALADAIPVNTWFDGKVDLGNFGSQIGQFSDAMKKFSDITVSQESIDTVKNAGTMIIELQKNIPESKWLDGKTDIDEFGAKIKAFGDHLISYSNSVSEIDTASVDSSITQANSLVTLAQKLVNIDTSGIDSFDVSSLASALYDYYDVVEDIDSTEIDQSVTSAHKIAGLVSSLVNLDTSGISKFNIRSVGDKIKGYSDAVSSMNLTAVTNSINAAIKLKNFINSLAGLNASGIAPFKVAVQNLGTIQINAVVKAFQDASVKLSNIGFDIITALANGMKTAQPFLITTSFSMIAFLVGKLRMSVHEFSKIGVALMTELTKGIISKHGTVIKAAISPLNTAATAMKLYYFQFYSAGSFLVDGFSAGISDNSYKAVAKAKAMALAAKKAAEEALGIASPSKVFYKIGSFTGEGFVKALDDYGDKSYKAGNEMADSARKGLSSAIAKIQDTINSGIDTQPTIRPVLDLSNIKSGAGAINGLFDNGVSVGATANLNAIGYMMNNNQNGGNDDIVSAINKLRKDLSNVGNTTYTIGDVTYDDGSNVATAVKDLVRAARIERRA